MENKKYKIFILFSLLLPTTFLLAGSDLYPCDGPNCEFGDMVKLVIAIVNRLTTYIFILSPIIIAWAGFHYIWNIQSSGKKEEAKKILQNLVTGLAIILLSWTIITVFLRVFANNEVLKMSPINPNKP